MAHSKKDERREEQTRRTRSRVVQWIDDDGIREEGRCLFREGRSKVREPA